MRRLQWIAAVLLLAILAAALTAPLLAPYHYDRQFRDAPDAPPGAQFPLGADSLGRDRFSRLLYGTAISLLLAPAAALVSIALALVIAVAGALGRRGMENTVSGVITIALSLPWIFLFLILRAELPLNTGPALSLVATFALMGVAGFAGPARVFTASIRSLRESGWLLQARAAGTDPLRIAWVHGWPWLRSLALAQFRVLIPVYILSEAGLGLLGLGVPEPLPSWGNLLQELQHPGVVRSNPWVLAPLGLLVLVMVCLEMLADERAVQA
jgi:peptide/nickel transport system permease protein